MITQAMADRALSAMVSGTLRLALHTASPTATNEISGSGYASIEIADSAWGLILSSGERLISVSSEMSFPTPGGQWSRASHIGLWNGLPSSGTLLWHDELDESFTAAANASVTIAANTVRFGFPVG